MIKLTAVSRGSVPPSQITELQHPFLYRLCILPISSYNKHIRTRIQSSFLRREMQFWRESNGRRGGDDATEPIEVWKRRGQKNLDNVVQFWHVIGCLFSNVNCTIAPKTTKGGNTWPCCLPCQLVEALLSFLCNNWIQSSAEILNLNECPQN